MIAAEKREWGTTLAELLVAVVFLAVCVSGIVACLVGSKHNASYAGRRAVALAAATSVIERARADARAGSLSLGTSGPVDVAGMPAPASCTCTVTRIGGTTDLYEVAVAVTWKEHPR